ncbi:Uncharacterised protein [uncultured archaeon]|nr:Uncharacterised protein [uncultured archaeon]
MAPSGKKPTKNAKASAGVVKSDLILRLKIKHAVMMIHGKEGPGGNRMQFGYVKRIAAINQLEEIGMSSSSTEIRESVQEGLLWGSTDPAEPVSRAALSAMSHMKR